MARREYIVPHDTILPPPRPGVRHVRVPLLGIVIADDVLRRRVNRRFHGPMIVLALMVIPFIAIDVFFLHRHPEMAGTPLWIAVLIGMTIIWLAFFVEFVVKIAIAECRIEYVKRNWLDIIIIAAPFLRPLRVWHVARTSKVFTLRGVGMKFLRYAISLLIGLEATERLLIRAGIKARRDRRRPEDMTRHEMETEIKRLRRLNDRWDEWHAAHEDHQKEHRREDEPAFDRPTPNDAPNDAADDALSPADDAPGERLAPPDAHAPT